MNDERPLMWIGHVQMAVPDVAAAKEFFLKLGIRDAFPDASEIAILELRAGTHLIVQESKTPVVKSTPAGFDLMAEDIEATNASLEQNGIKPSALLHGSIHTTFKVTEPNGHVITYLNSHNTGSPV